MKTKLFFALLIATAMAMAQGQTDSPWSQCFYLGAGSSQSMRITQVKGMKTVSTVSTGTRNMVLLFCVEQGQSESIPMAVINSMRSNIPSYFAKATFNNWSMNVLDVLVASNDGTTAHAFVLPGLIGGDDFIPASYVDTVLKHADAIYNFADYDIDHDGIVDYLAFICYRQTTGTSRGTVGLPIDDYYTTSDFKNINGTQVQVRIDGTGFEFGNDHSFTERVNDSPERAESMMFHEMGHSLFGWPDVDHCGFTDYNHSSFGDFDVMSSGWGGFNNVSSLYNPAFRAARGWVTPATASGTLTFSDFDATGQIFSYNLPSYSNAVANQQYYFTYYTKDQNNHWQANWDVPRLSNGNYAGVLTWRTVGTDILSNCTFGDRKAMPITLESAHGKWDWNENNSPDNHAINTGQADILNGLDSLQERWSYIWQKYNYQTGKLENVLYRGSLYQVGSASCFFDPEHYKTFAFYTNPSSNEIASADESRSITPGFAMKNLRLESGQVKADFVSGTSAYTITENATLTTGTWYINNTVTVAPGVTLTINPGATLQFSSGASLVVNSRGTLTANGNSSQRITFTSTSGNWGGIQFQAGSGGALNYCNISHATRGVYLNHTSITTQNCTISGNSIGIQVDEVNVANFSIQNNTISNNSSHGIYINSCWYSGSSAGIANNTISYNGGDGICVEYSVYGNFPVTWNTISHNWGDGIYCYYLSSPVILNNLIEYNRNEVVADYYSPAKLISPGYSDGHNVLRSDGRCLVATNGSNVNAGQYSFGLNSFDWNLMDYAFYIVNSNVEADYDYWGGTYPTAYISGGSLNYYTVLYDDPNPGRGNMMVVNPSSKTPLKKTSSAPVRSDTNSFFDPGLRAALDSLYNGNYENAINQYSKRYSMEKDISKKRYVLIQLAECYARGNKGGFVDFLNSNVRSNIKKNDLLYATSLELENYFLVQSGKHDKAIANFNTLLSDFASDTTMVKHALYNMWSLYSHEVRDTLKANEYLAELKNKFTKDELTRHAMLLVGEGSDIFASSGSDKNKDSSRSVSSSKSGLLANYPNPFNPTTVIGYQLSVSGHVTLKVYDILGREVTTIVNESQNPGIHSATFDASRLASGVYFYRLTAPGVNQVKKMLLTK